VSKRMWAGWRMHYIREANRARDGIQGSEAGACLFCGLLDREPSVESLVLETYPRSFLMLNAYPYTTGHMMVASRRHDDSLLGESDEERAEIMAAVERARRVLAAEYRPEALNIGLNLGLPAGAGVPGHLHWHVVPRWTGDTNFMPVLMETRVIPEALPDTYTRLIEALTRLTPAGLHVVGRGHAA
jgi:ATP adenylyltransferase